ncbi:growth hormone secretagogue receptor type 1-like [Physella acuta]|uniref:growth hormone secretagogue receptor type 1-like n=1 Tax=Physella acuta TaxID=109671 RepID=UPI0027DE734C|nr:growth hormone secretagogue receptor type 1-like [Physella acuta]
MSSIYRLYWHLVHELDDDISAVQHHSITDVQHHNSTDGQQHYGTDAQHHNKQSTRNDSSTASYIVTYGMYLAFVVGIPGNILTLPILFRMKPFNSSNLWLVVVCINDIFSMVYRAIINILFNYNLIALNDSFCRFIYIASDVTEYSGYFCLVGITVERLIAVWFPLKMSLWCTKKKAAIGIFVIFAFITGQAQQYNETVRFNGLCLVRLKYRPIVERLYYLTLINTVFAMLPITALVVLNILIRVKLTSARKFQKQMSDQQNKEKDKQQQQINRMLMAASIWLIICVSPDTVYRYVDYALVWTGIEPGTMPHNIVRIKYFLDVTCGVLKVYNHAANFILYVVAARKFRTELIKMVTCNRYGGTVKDANSKKNTSNSQDSKSTQNTTD